MLRDLPVCPLSRICRGSTQISTAWQPCRVVLDTLGTKDDLERHGLTFEEGLHVLFYDPDATEHHDPDDLLGVGVITWDEHWGSVGIIEGELLNESEWDTSSASPGD